MLLVDSSCGISGKRNAKRNYTIVCVCVCVCNVCVCVCVYNVYVCVYVTYVCTRAPLGKIHHSVFQFLNQK